jgi:quinoprotein glucose dehydrogenase
MSHPAARRSRASILRGAGLVAVLTSATLRPQGAADRDWAVYLGDAASSQYSSLNQINTGNVHRLEVAWTYRAGDARADNRSQIQCNPLVIDGVLYATTPQLKVVALDAATGRERWRFDPFAGGADLNSLGVNRGLVYWAEGRDRRILFAASHYLHALDAGTGRPIPSFGKEGRADLLEDLDHDTRGLYLLSNTPGIVYRDLLILGSRVSEGPGPAAPGHIRAYNVRTGKREWIFHTVPHPGEPGYETWPPDAWQYIGGANGWTGMALDARRGWVFIPTGSAAFDFWGGNRIGANLFANCLLVLDAATGRRVWHYQFVHHDLWDRDLPAPPNLLTVQHGGRRVDAVAQVTKSGHVFLFDRETGAPLFPIEHRPVPASDLPGESASTNQPLPLLPKPFSRQQFTESEVTDISPEARANVLDRFRKVRPHQPFLPPSREGTIIFPGFDGGAEWGGSAVDPRAGVLYVNANEMPWILTMVDTRPKDGELAFSSGHQMYNQLCAACHGIDRAGDPLRTIPSLVGVEQRVKREDAVLQLETGKGVMPSFAFLSRRQRELVTAYAFGEETSDSGKAETTGGNALDTIPFTHTGYNRFLDPNGYPAVKPPWGTLNAIDLNTGEYRWTVTLGEFPELTARGIPPTGTENYGGPAVTAGGLLFIGATKDEMFRAFDTTDGRLLWQSKLPAGGYATPSTYIAGGRQFVVIACGGGKMGTPSGDAYVAFALPAQP